MQRQAKVSITADDGTRVGSGTYKLDPAAKPKALDVRVTKGADTEVDMRFEAIYKLEGDKLTICVPTPGNTTRPTAFEANKGDKQALMVLKRR